MDEFYTSEGRGTFVERNKQEKTQGQVEKQFRPADKNSDFALDIQEIKVLFPKLPIKKIREVVRKADKDKDGKLNIAEFKSQLGAKAL